MLKFHATEMMTWTWTILTMTHPPDQDINGRTPDALPQQLTLATIAVEDDTLSLMMTVCLAKQEILGTPEMSEKIEIRVQHETLAMGMIHAMDLHGVLTRIWILIRTRELDLSTRVTLVTIPVMMLAYWTVVTLAMTHAWLIPGYRTYAAWIHACNQILANSLVILNSLSFIVMSADGKFLLMLVQTLGQTLEQTHAFVILAMKILDSGKILAMPLDCQETM